MKTINTAELDFIAQDLQTLVGAEFQQITEEEGLICLHFWKNKAFKLVLNLLSGAPFVLKLENKKDFSPLPKKNYKKPLGLFLKTHFLRKDLVSVERLKDYGRILKFDFEGGSSLEVRLFSGGANLSAFCGDKSVHLKKPSPLEKIQEVQDFLEVRSPAVVYSEALSQMQAKLNKNVDSTEQDKTFKAIEKIKQGLEKLEKNLFFKAAQALEQGQSLDEELQALCSKSLSLQENIDKLYKQSKDKDRKIKRLKERLAELEKNPISKGLEGQSRSFQKLSELNVKAHVLVLDKKLRALCGRSSVENLKLLRKAKAWYLWVHLKDYPSGHVVVEKPKTYTLNEEELYRVSKFLFEKGAPKKILSGNSPKFEVMFCECRHVKPIKGAKAGLVQAKNYKTRLFTYER